MIIRNHRRGVWKIEHVMRRNKENCRAPIYSIEGRQNNKEDNGRKENKFARKYCIDEER